MDIQDFVGREIQFSCEPYHGGTMQITKITPCQHSDPKYGFHSVEGLTTSATQTSRIGGTYSSQPYDGRHVELHYITLADLESGRIRYVYPV